MNKNIWIVLVVLVVLLGGAIYLLQNRGGQSSQPQTALPSPAAQQATPSPVAASGQSKTYTIEMTANGFSPDAVTIRAGDTVTFVNKDSVAHWPASDPHPIHTTCPGFDALRPLAPGETYSFTFTQAKACPFHDHLMARVKGTITVRQ